MSIEFVPETPVVIDAETASIIEDNAATEEASDVVPENPDALIRVLKSGNCPSLTARSTLGYQLGLKDESELYGPEIDQQHRQWFLQQGMGGVLGD